MVLFYDYILSKYYILVLPLHDGPAWICIRHYYYFIRFLSQSSRTGGGDYTGARPLLHKLKKTAFPTSTLPVDLTVVP